MFNTLSLQDLKRTGFNKLKQMFNNEPDILIQERGKDVCVLVDLDYYNHLKTCELEASLIQAKQEIANGKYTTDVKAHIETLENIVAQDIAGAALNV
jgi:hypothetical protein